MRSRSETCSGVLVGTAVGDSLGLPAEGMSRHRIQALWHGVWRHRLVFGHGLVSDDTEHAALVALCLAKCRDDSAQFQRALSWKLRLWFACLPPGVGLATARACIKMWLGFGPRSGVFSAGNGPAMRAAIIGAFFADDRDRRQGFVTASTQLTHTDPKANWASLAIAECAALEAREAFTVRACREQLDAISDATEWRELVSKIFDALQSAASVDEFAASIGQRDAVTGYSFHSVPVAIYSWLRHRPNIEQALMSSLNCGGDTDSVGAIVGGIAGAALGPNGFPQNWVEPICDWPFGVKQLQRMGADLGGPRAAPPMLIWPLIFLRNMATLLIVIFHGFRRVFPPYGTRRNASQLTN